MSYQLKSFLALMEHGVVEWDILEQNFTKRVCLPLSSIQHYVIKFVSHLRQVCGFLQILWFPPPIKLAVTI
jgi:hypothetical protein